MLLRAQGVKEARASAVSVQGICGCVLCTNYRNPPPRPCVNEPVVGSHEPTAAFLEREIPSATDRGLDGRSSFSGLL